MSTAEAHVSLTYRGDAVDEGLMRVEDLAPAMLGASRAFQRAQRVATGGNGPMPEVHVRALRQGSFAVDLVLVEGSLISDAIDLLSGDKTTAAVNLATAVTVTFGGFKLIKAGFNRVAHKREVKGKNVTITFDDGTVLEIPAASEKLAKDPEFTAAAREVVTPLEVAGVEEVELDGGDDALKVSREERAAFAPTREIDGVEESIVDMSLSPATVSFTEGNKWKVSDGASTFYVGIADEAFAEQVELGNEAFAKGDVIRARVQIRQWREQGKLKIDRSILKVLEHRKAIDPDELPFA